MSDIPDPVDPRELVDLPEWIQEIELACSNWRRAKKEAPKLQQHWYTRIIGTKKEVEVVTKVSEHVISDIERLIEEIRVLNVINTDLKRGLDELYYVQAHNPMDDTVSPTERPEIFGSLYEAGLFAKIDSEEGCRSHETIYVRSFPNHFLVQRWFRGVLINIADDIRCEECFGYGMRYSSVSEDIYGTCKKCHGDGLRPGVDLEVLKKSLEAANKK